MVPSPMHVLCMGPMDDNHSRMDEGQAHPPHDELHLAVLTGRTKKIKNLLRKGVHIESVNGHGQTPLFCASFGGDNEVVSLLLGLGANPNRRCGGKGATPVHAAAYRGSRRVLRLLVEAGGDLAVTDSETHTPRDYALKQPSPIRRQKILHFLDLLLAMTLHRSLARSSTFDPSHTSSPPILQTSTASTLPHATSKTSLALKRQGSLASVWGACMTNGAASSPRSPPYTSPPPTSTLPKTVSCHMLDQMYVSTSLPLLTPADLHRPEVTEIAYTCGGPTVYSPYTWLGTKVTVRRPTPALSLPKNNTKKELGEDLSCLDGSACKSLLQELSVLRRLRHPGFLEVMAACHVTSPSPDHVTLVFQHIQHGSLYHHLHVQHRDLSVGGAVDLLVGVVEAIIFLHAHSWLHTAITSHSLHLVSTHHAKLGGFEFAMEMHGKGCSMRAPQLSPATWLTPWQAPETLMEQMVSMRSEVYAITAVIWEVWAGMPPWSGVEEEEVKRRVGEGDTLPTLTPTPPSLITYLTQYGLTWNSHQRDIDLQEIHTMLRSLKIQSKEEERVPVVPAWGPPSVPNTPVIARHSRSTTPSQSLQHSNNTSSSHPPTPSHSTNISPLKPQIVKSRSDTPTHPNTVQTHITDTPKPIKTPIIETKITLGGQVTVADDLHTREESTQVQLNHRLTQEVPVKNKALQAVDSGFSTPCTRTPSPNSDTITSAKINPSFLTSTLARPPSSCILRADLQPDLLPNKMTLKTISNGHTPDILLRPRAEAVKETCRNIDVPSFNPPTSPLTPAIPTMDLNDSSLSSPGGEGAGVSGYGFISNAAKRAFLMESEGSDMAMDRPTSVCRRESSDMYHTTNIVRRGLSLSNISMAVQAAGLPHTASHVSLASESSSGNSDMCGKRPVRTVSQVTLTMRKLSHVSDSSSSKDEVCEEIAKEKCKGRRIQRQASNSPRHTTSIWQDSVPGHNTEDTAIKPASHQLIRHSSSCSLASGLSSPNHHSYSSSSPWVALSNVKQAHQQLQQNATPLPSPPSHITLHLPPDSSTPQHISSPPPPPFSRAAKGGVGRRWKSVSGTPTGLTETAVKIQPRRLSEGQRTRPRRSRRRQEMEVEEEFFDDEFNALLFQQPHMQLSVGSSENLLDSRAPHSMLADGTVSPANLGLSSFSPSLTSSEDEEDEVGMMRRPLGGAITHWRRLGAVEEREKMDEDEGEKGGVDENNEDGMWRCKDFQMDFEPLKSVQLLRNLRSLNVYLPTHSIGSDTDIGDI